LIDMTILITGGSGFVGWNAVRYFAGRGNDVVATFHTFPHYLHKVDGCQPVPLDLADGGAIDRVVARFQPHIIMDKRRKEKRTRVPRGTTIKVERP